MQQAPDALGDQQECKTLYGKVRLFARELNNYFAAHQNERDANEKLLENVEHFRSYLSTMINQHASMLTFAELKTASNLIGGTFSFLEKGEHCLEVVKHQVGPFLCYLTYNNSDAIRNYDISYILDTPSLNKKGRLNSTVISKNLDVVTTNRNWTDERYLKIESISCTNIGG